MQVAEFRKRARREGLRYAQDRMVFLRELAQNSRDAGASLIRVTTADHGHDLSLSFTDDGEGMTYAHARRYLFTLYASSKERDTESAGRFGVGFWSVLLFEPDRIRIESSTPDGDGFAIDLDGDLERHERGAPELDGQGTRITLTRRIADRVEAERLRIEIGQALTRYCRYLRARGRRAEPLQVMFDEREMEEPFRLEGPCWMRFQDGAVEGAVGLGERPRIDLYARGLLVWQGTLLEELRYGAERANNKTQYSAGLAPVYLINGNDLNVTLDRRAVIDDRALARVRLVARRRMRELLARYLDRVSPRPLNERIADWVRGLVEEARLGGLARPALAAGSLVSLLAAVALLIWMTVAPPTGDDPELPPGPPGPPTPPQLQAIPLGEPLTFDGPMVDPLPLTDVLPLTFEPPGDQLFRLTAAEELHAGRGITAGPPRPLAPAIPWRCVNGCLSVRTTISSGPGPLVLPVPTGHRVDPSGVLLDGRPVVGLMRGHAGETLIELAGRQRGTLHYTTGPVQELLTAERIDELTHVPAEMTLPPELGALAVRARQQPSIVTRVELVRSYLESRLIYDRSGLTAAEYGGFLAGSPERGWLEFVMLRGRGDCDVKNTVAVAVLRRAGVPARLAIGVVANRGRALSGLHAWIEYHTGTWRVADASGISPGASAPGPGLTPASTGPPAPPPSGPLPAPAPEPSATGADPARPEAPEEGSLRNVVLTTAGTVALIAIAVALLLLVAGGGERRIFARGGGKVRRRVAAEMLMSALARPEVWHGGSGLLGRRLIPLLGSNRRISLSEVLALGRQGSLWTSKRGSELARRIADRGGAVLDGTDGAFGKLVRRLPGATDLDQLARLRPVTPEELPPEMVAVTRLLSSADRLLMRAGQRAQLIRPCLGLSDSVSRDVDLGSARLPRGSTWQRPFIGVSPYHPSVRDLAALGRSRRELAAYLLVDMLLGRSGLLDPETEHVRHVVALEVLGEVVS